MIDVGGPSPPIGTLVEPDGPSNPAGEPAQTWEVNASEQRQSWMLDGRFQSALISVLLLGVHYKERQWQFTLSFGLGIAPCQFLFWDSS